MMGGVHTDIHGATPLAGLYAAGETACVSINGANRLGSNSLPECLVFGARAGRAAAEYAAERGRRRRPRSRPRPPTRCAGSSATCSARSRRPRRDRRDPRRDAGRPWRRAPASTAPGRRWPRARTSSGELQERFARRRRRRPSRTFNTELVAALELANMLDVAECILAVRRCSREESRGAHQRTDFPARDDERFLAHSLVHRDAGRVAAGRVPAGDDHPLAAGRAGLREVSRMADTHHACRSRATGRTGDATPTVAGRTTSRCARTGRSSTGSTTSRTSSTAPCRSAGRAGWASAAAAA